MRNSWYISTIKNKNGLWLIEINSVNYNVYGMCDPRLIVNFQELTEALQFGKFTTSDIPEYENDVIQILDGSKIIATVTGDILLGWIFIESNDSIFIELVSGLLGPALNTQYTGENHE